MNEGHALASTLEPVLREACGGRLSPVRWFHATWQHGGAGTGFAEWTTRRGQKIECVVKLPVSYQEYAWTKRLGLTGEDDWNRSEPASLPTPRVLAGGFELGAYDFAWLVMERFPGNPLGAQEMTDSDVWGLLEVTAEFHAAAILEQPVDPAHRSKDPDWVGMLDRALRKARDLENGDRWQRAIGRVQADLDGPQGLLARWEARPTDTWCHRDVHAHNAMRRAPDDGCNHGKLALIDLALVSAGCWIEDALYLERMCWGRPEVLCGVEPLETLWRARTALGLPSNEGDLAVADVRRVLMASTSPAFSRTQGDPMYLSAALARLEGLLPSVCG